MSSRNRDRTIRGDFQTPESLARQIWSQIDTNGIAGVIEPTVGKGVFLACAPDSLHGIPWLGLDIEPEHVEASRSVAALKQFQNSRIVVGNAFELSPAQLRHFDPDAPILAIGNPPWVTAAAQGRLSGANLPVKSNKGFGLPGLDALTGKANFDIAEAILLRLLDALHEFRDVQLAFLVKRTVATKIAKRLMGVAEVMSFSRIDSAKNFGVSVDAGLFYARRCQPPQEGVSYIELSEAIGAAPTRRAGFRNGRFVEDLEAHRVLAHYESDKPVPWRQGVKHDIAKVLELKSSTDGIVNGFGELVDIESTALHPLYKGSDIANGRSPSRLFPLYQVDLTGPSPQLASKWPRLATYLEAHREFFHARRSRIYEGKHPYALFGIGPYTLAPWKVAVSGLHSSARFQVIGPSSDGHPPLVDDTCYLLPFENRVDARKVASHLNASSSQQLLKALIDPRSKRPITKGCLSRIAVPVEPVENPAALQLALSEAA